jgi:hypothetical protein
LPTGGIVINNPGCKTMNNRTNNHIPIYEFETNLTDVAGTPFTPQHSSTPLFKVYTIWPLEFVLYSILVILNIFVWPLMTVETLFPILAVFPSLIGTLIVKGAPEPAPEPALEPEPELAIGAVILPEAGV